MIVFEDKRNGKCGRAEDKSSSERLLGPSCQATAALSGTRTRLKKKRWRAWNGPSHPEQLISGLILKLSGSEGSRIFFFFTRAGKFHHREQLGRIKRMCYQQQRDIIIQRGWTGVDLLKCCRAAGHRGLPPLLGPKLCDMSNNQQIPPGSFWECWFVSGVWTSVWVEGRSDWTQQRQQSKYSAPIFHQLLGVWTIRWGAVHLLDSSTQWLLFDRLTHIIDLMYYSSPNQLRNNRRRAQKMQTDTGGHRHSEGALGLLCRWSQRAGISQQPSRLVSLKTGLTCSPLTAAPLQPEQMADCRHKCQSAEIRDSESLWSDSRHLCEDLLTYARTYTNLSAAWVW